MTVKMLRYAAVEPERVAVIHAGARIAFNSFSFFDVKSKYFNSWVGMALGGMLIAKKFRSLRGNVCFPFYRKQAILNRQ
jgi:hypothetical protein